MKVANYSFWRKYDEDIDLWQWFPDIQIPIPKAFFHFSYFVIFRAYSHTDKRCITFSYLLKSGKTQFDLNQLYYFTDFCFVLTIVSKRQFTKTNKSFSVIRKIVWYQLFLNFILLVAEVFPCTNRHLFVTCLTLWARVICRKSS